MSVHYKFKSSLDYDTVTFDGLHISVGDLKKAILQQKKIGRVFDFDLQITNAQTKEVYADEDSLVPKNASVIVSRVPNGNSSKKSWDRNESSFAVPITPYDASESASYDKVTKNADLTAINVPEDEKIKAMMSQSTQDYDPSRYVKMKGMSGPLPPNYLCYRCGRAGHWIKNCPTNVVEVKRSTGIPRSFMVTVDGPEVPGALLTSTGQYAVPMIDQTCTHEKCDRFNLVDVFEASTEAYKEGKKEKPPFSKEFSPEKQLCPHIPEELLCMICRDLLADAVLIACCGNSYCDECVRQALLDSDDHECPTCHEKGISPDTLIPNRFLRTAVLNFKNETGYTKLRKSLQKSEEIPVAAQADSTSSSVLELGEPILLVGEQPNVAEDVDSKGAVVPASVYRPGTPVRDERLTDAVEDLGRGCDSSQGDQECNSVEEPEAFTISTITTRWPVPVIPVPSLLPNKQRIKSSPRDTRGGGPPPPPAELLKRMPYGDDSGPPVHRGSREPPAPPGHSMRHPLPPRSTLSEVHPASYPSVISGINTTSHSGRPGYPAPPPMGKLHPNMPPSLLGLPPPQMLHQPPPPHFAQNIRPPPPSMYSPIPSLFQGPPPPLHHHQQHRRSVVSPPSGNQPMQPLPPGLRVLPPPPVHHPHHHPPPPPHLMPPHMDPFRHHQHQGMGIPTHYTARADAYYRDNRNYGDSDHPDPYGHHAYDYRHEDHRHARRSSSSSKSYSRSASSRSRSHSRTRSSRSHSPYSRSERSRSYTPSLSRSRSVSHSRSPYVHRSRSRSTSRVRSRSVSKHRHARHLSSPFHRRSRSRSPRRGGAGGGGGIPSRRPEIPPNDYYNAGAYRGSNAMPVPSPLVSNAPYGMHRGRYPADPYKYDYYNYEADPHYGAHYDVARYDEYYRGGGAVHDKRARMWSPLVPAKGDEYRKMPDAGRRGAAAVTATSSSRRSQSRSPSSSRRRSSSRGVDRSSRREKTSKHQKELDTDNQKDKSSKSRSVKAKTGSSDEKVDSSERKSDKRRESRKSSSNVDTCAEAKSETTKATDSQSSDKSKDKKHKRKHHTSEEDTPSKRAKSKRKGGPDEESSSTTEQESKKHSSKRNERHESAEVRQPPIESSRVVPSGTHATAMGDISGNTKELSYVVTSGEFVPASGKEYAKSSEKDLTVKLNPNDETIGYDKDMLENISDNGIQDCIEDTDDQTLESITATAGMETQCSSNLGDVNHTAVDIETCGTDQVLPVAGVVSAATESAGIVSEVAGANGEEVLTAQIPELSKWELFDSDVSHHTDYLEATPANKLKSEKKTLPADIVQRAEKAILQKVMKPAMPEKSSSDARKVAVADGHDRRSPFETSSAGEKDDGDKQRVTANNDNASRKVTDNSATKEKNSGSSSSNKLSSRERLKLDRSKFVDADKEQSAGHDSAGGNAVAATSSRPSKKSERSGESSDKDKPKTSSKDKASEGSSTRSHASDVPSFDNRHSKDYYRSKSGSCERRSRQDVHGGYSAGGSHRRHSPKSTERSERSSTYSSSSKNHGGREHSRGSSDRSRRSQHEKESSDHRQYSSRHDKRSEDGTKDSDRSSYKKDDRDKWKSKESSTKPHSSDPSSAKKHSSAAGEATKNERKSLSDTNDKPRSASKPPSGGGGGGHSADRLDRRASVTLDESQFEPNYDDFGEESVAVVVVSKTISTASASSSGDGGGGGAKDAETTVQQQVQQQQQPQKQRLESRGSSSSRDSSTDSSGRAQKRDKKAAGSSGDESSDRQLGGKHKKNKHKKHKKHKHKHKKKSKKSKEDTATTAKK